MCGLEEDSLPMCLACSKASRRSVGCLCCKVIDFVLLALGYARNNGASELDPQC